MKKVIAFISSSVVSFAICIYGLVKFILSSEIWKDKYGTDVSFNEDYLILMVVSFIIFAYLAYEAYCALKNINHKNYYKETAMLSSFIIVCYDLGIYFKAYFKALSKGKEFASADYRIYLIIGIVFLVIFTAVTIKYFLDKKKSK